MQIPQSKMQPLASITTKCAGTTIWPVWNLQSPHVGIATEESELVNRKQIGKKIIRRKFGEMMGMCIALKVVTAVQ